jgi:hypothetical protein
MLTIMTVTTATHARASREACRNASRRCKKASGETSNAALTIHVLRSKRSVLTNELKAVVGEEAAAAPARRNAASSRDCAGLPATPSGAARNASRARGIESPTTIRYDVATPKHLSRMARSTSTPLPGTARSATDPKVAVRPTLRPASESR